MSLYEENKPFLVGICGGTGSGKTMVAKKLQSVSPKNIIILSHDNYYKDRSTTPLKERKFLNYDYPGALDNDLFLEHLKNCIAGKPSKCLGTVSLPIHGKRERRRLPQLQLLLLRVF